MFYISVFVKELNKLLLTIKIELSSSPNHSLYFALNDMLNEHKDLKRYC